MSTIPKEIQEEAERRFPNREYNNQGGYTDQEYNILFKEISDEIKQRQQDFIAGYQLATDGREELEKENERLRAENSGLRYAISQLKEKYNL
jgi:FtsZ-binding cell division protein ZapB